MKNKPKKIAVLAALALIISAAIYAQNAAKTVYVTNSGTKYHTQNCSTLNKAKEVIPIDEQEALEKGYTPCARCKP
ncbi:MAG: hypothetical protein MJ159_05070 [Treponemataceae bacterium]|nr:hypothetical protein [Treponemataceae bacterium]